MSSGPKWKRRGCDREHPPWSKALEWTIPENEPTTRVSLSLRSESSDARRPRSRWRLLVLGAAVLFAAFLIELEPADGGTRIKRKQKGIASWYGPGFHGRQTANGETFDMEAMTAAHRTLPFDTIVRVRHLANGRTVDVRINDRGPFKRGRIVDLSRAAAREIGLLEKGTARVELRVLRTGAD